MPVPQWILPTVLPNLGGIAGSFITRSQIPTWYKDLKKPWFNPPPYVFGPTWTALYSGMGYASYLVWKNGGGFSGAAKTPLILYGSQLALNWIWTPLFFGMHRLDLALADVALMTGIAGACAVKFHEVDETAGLLMLPYLAWLSFATLLTFCIWRDNKPGDKKVKKSL